MIDWSDVLDLFLSLFIAIFSIGFALALTFLMFMSIIWAFTLLGVIT
jgi:hypothetical protein